MRGGSLICWTLDHSLLRECLGDGSSSTVISRHPDKVLMVGMLSDLLAIASPIEARPIVVHTDSGSVYMGGG